MVVWAASVALEVWVELAASVVPVVLAVREASVVQVVSVGQGAWVE